MSEHTTTAVDPARFAGCHYLSGPTASGKTAVGVQLALAIGAEVVSLDSMAIFRGMDIGTAKPSLQERARVAHRLIDLVAPQEDFSVAEYLARAADVVEEIRQRGQQALFVGGTPLYLKSLLRGICSGPEADWSVRERWLAAHETHGNQWLHEQLAKVDPAAAVRLHPNDVRRIVRALEVHELTGAPISGLQEQFDTSRATGTTVYVLDWPREALHERINRRVDQMFAAGLVDEVERLRQGGGLSRTALQAVGYAETIEHLEGKRPLAETIELVKTRTRQFAKRQMTWFRGLPECRFVPLAEPLDPADVAASIAAMMKQ